MDRLRAVITAHPWSPLELVVLAGIGLLVAYVIGDLVTGWVRRVRRDREHTRVVRARLLRDRHGRWGDAA